jgi:hypothetical protein
MAAIIECSIIAKGKFGFIAIVDESIHSIEKGDTVRDNVVGRRCCCPTAQFEAISITREIGEPPSVKSAHHLFEMRV